MSEAMGREDLTAIVALTLFSATLLIAWVIITRPAF